MGMPCRILTLTSSNKNGFQSNITDHKNFSSLISVMGLLRRAALRGKPPLLLEDVGGLASVYLDLIYCHHRQAKGKPGKPDKNTYYDNMHFLFNKGMDEKEIEPSDQNTGSCHKGFERDVLILSSLRWSPPPACCQLGLMKPLAHLRQWTMLSELAG